MKIVLVDSHLVKWGDEYALERAAWEALGAEFVLAECSTEAQLVEAGHDADILAYGGLYTPFTAAVMAQLPRCQLIARYGIGVDSVDLDAATAQGIVVANAAEYCVPEVADHATALILALARRIVWSDRWVRAGKWAGFPAQAGSMPRLSTQSVGLVGFGRIARRVAHNLRAIFGKIIAYDPYVDPAQAEALGVQMVPELDRLLAEADYISVHTPLLPQTRGLIGAAQFAKMKPTAYLINTSRGPVIDEAALVAALQAGTLAGAALDVFDPEPLVDNSPLRTMENVVLTSHIAAYSLQAVEDLRAAVIATICDVIQGVLPRYVMNPSVKPRGGLRPRPSTH